MGHRPVTAFCLIAATSIAPLACEQRSGDTSVRTNLSWTLVDGRPCDLGGISEVWVLDVGDGDARAHCTDGLAPNTVAIEVSPPLPRRVTVEGRSIRGALMYRGRVEVDESSEGATESVVLSFVGGERSQR